MARRLKEDAGTGIVEFVLVAPILLLIVFAMMEFGRVLDAWVVVDNAAREGARVGAVTWPESLTLAAAQDAAEAYLTLGLGGRGDIAAMTVEPPTMDGETMKVRTAAQVYVYTPLFQSIVGSPLTVGARATMRRQW